MYKGKRVLLIAGGGTLGTYVSRELLRLGASVEVICPEEKISHHKNLTFHQSLGRIRRYVRPSGGDRGTLTGVAV